MTAQPALFDVNETTARACPVHTCAAVRLAGQKAQLPTCQHDLDRAVGHPGRRPAACLNKIDPAHQEIPY